MQAQIDELDEARKQIITNRAMTETSKRHRCKPLNANIKELTKAMNIFEKVRSKHFGILDKLPKDSTLYSFVYNCQFAKRIQYATNKKIEEEKVAFDKFIESDDQ
jgi:ribosomal protein L9